MNYASQIIKSIYGKDKKPEKKIIIKKNKNALIIKNHNKTLKLDVLYDENDENDWKDIKEKGKESEQGKGNFKKGPRKGRPKKSDQQKANDELLLRQKKQEANKKYRNKQK